MALTRVKKFHEKFCHGSLAEYPGTGHSHGRHDGSELERRHYRGQFYKKSLQRIIEIMQEPFIGGRYVPIIVVGITNGGGIFADLLARDCYSGRVPITSLWANRTNQNEYFFNPLNEAAAKVITDLAEGRSNPSLLLVDDIVASGTTHHQAIQFLMSRLPGLDIRFLPLFSRNEKYFDLVKERIIWKHKAFDLTDAEIFKLHHTDWLRLPYDKDIRSS